MQSEKMDIGTKSRGLAILLSLLYPGLGHFYITEWIRGFFWFGFWFLMFTFLNPFENIDNARSFSELLNSIPPGIYLIYLTSYLASVVDIIYLVRSSR
jgi:hypothetical protein